MEQLEFIFLGSVRFRGLFQREHALSLELAARGFRVTYVEEMPSLAALLRRWRDKILDGPFRWNEPVVDRVPDTFHVLTPPLVPTFFRSSYTPVIDRALFKHWFARKFKGQPWSRTVVVLMNPYWWNGFVRPREIETARIVYDMSDSLELMSRTPSALETMRESEQEVLKVATLVTYTALGMESRWLHVVDREKTLRLPDAVSKEFCSRSTNGERSGAVPVVSYVGSLDERSVDFELLWYLVRSLPDVRFEFAGPMPRSFKRGFLSFGNVSCLGFLKFEAIPGFLDRADVCIIPFLRNPVTEVVNPNKLFQYAALGKPIVGTRTAELEQYQEVVRLVDTPGQFAAEIRNALKEQHAAEADRLRAFARANTWERRVEALLSRLI